MTVKEAFNILHNLEIREPLRKYHPQHAMIAINEKGEVVGIEKFKGMPSLENEEKVFSKYRRTAIFYADTEIYPTIEELEEKVEQCRESLKNRESLRKNKGKGLIGDTYYGGKAD